MTTHPHKKVLQKIKNEGTIQSAKKISRVIFPKYKYIYRRLVINHRNHLMKKKYDAVANIYKIINICPRNINKSLIKPRPPWYENKYSTYGRVQDGDWDVEFTEAFEKDKQYQSIKSHFLQDVEWEESGIIEYYENQNKKIRNDEKKEILDYYKSIDDLYNKIKQQGYKKTRIFNPWDPRKYDVVSVHIGRDGEFIFSGSGNHRLSIAKILELDKIPVRVLMRHERWQELRDDIYNNNFHNQREELRDHPDLQDIR